MLSRRSNRRPHAGSGSSYLNQYRQERSSAPRDLQIELVPEVSLLNAADHLVVEKVSPVLCIFPFWKRTTYLHGILLENDPMSDTFMKVASYERKRKKEKCSILDILKFTSNYNLYRVIYDDDANLKSADDVINIATYIADNPTHLEYHQFCNSEDFAVFCRIEWARTSRRNGSYAGDQENQGFFWDEDIDPISELDISPLIAQDQL